MTQNYSRWINEQCQKCNSKRVNITKTVHKAVSVVCDNCGHTTNEVQWLETVTCDNCGHVEQYELTVPTE